MDSNKYGLVNLIEGKNKPPTSVPCSFLIPFLLLSPTINTKRKMVKQKQRWTREEEEALRAGVEKYGQGKWKRILTDPEFAPFFVNRSNIDLKDKWRNLTVSAAGSCSRQSVRTPVLGPDLNLTMNGTESSGTERVETPVLGFDLNQPGSLEPNTVLPLVTYGGTPAPSSVLPVVPYGGTPEPSRTTVLPLVPYRGTPEPSRTTVDTRVAPDYEAMILEALSTIQDPNGLDVTTILKFIEETYELPQNYRRSVTSKLRRLLLTREFVKVGNRYKHKTSGQEDAIPMNVENVNEGENVKNTSGQEEAIPMNVENMNEGEDEEDEPGKETPEDAARVLAYKIARAEHMEHVAIKTCKEADPLEELLEESMAMLKIAEEIHERCMRDGSVVLKV